MASTKPIRATAAGAMPTHMPTSMSARTGAICRNPSPCMSLYPLHARVYTHVHARIRASHSGSGGSSIGQRPSSLLHRTFDRMFDRMFLCGSHRPSSPSQSIDLDDIDASWALDVRQAAPDPRHTPPPKGQWAHASTGTSLSKVQWTWA